MPNPGRRDNRCTVHRATENRIGPGDVDRVWAVQGTEWVGLRALGSGLGDAGPGETPIGQAEGEARPGAGIQLGDVLAVEAGPYVGGNWRVVAVFPEGIRSVSLRLQRYTGDLA